MSLWTARINYVWPHSSDEGRTVSVSLECSSWGPGESLQVEEIEERLVVLLSALGVDYRRAWEEYVARLTSVTLTPA